MRRSVLLSAGVLLWLAVAGCAQRIVPARVRRSASDLEVTGRIAGLPPGTTGYVSAAQLASLPQVTAGIAADENFPASVAATMQVRGVLLSVLREALGAGADLIDAWCTDRYRAHYPASYVTAHRPILALTVNGKTPSAWAADAHQYDPGPYFVTHERFVPSFRVLSHADEAQVPTNVVRINFSTEAATFGAITPPGEIAAGSPVAEGLVIARQNCLRCHFRGEVGGRKSGIGWEVLSGLARAQPAYFAAYVNAPKTINPQAQMPGFPRYDAATLGALAAYFAAFPAALSPAGGKVEAP